jgi:hypothetical protein
MAKKHEKSFTIPGNKGMQIKTTLRFHLTPVRMAIIKNHQQQMLERMQEKGTLIHCWWECKLIQPLWKIIWKFI